MSTKKIQIIGSLGNNKIYTQNDEPIDVADGTLWVDLDAEGGADDSTYVLIDTTLTQSGWAADAKVVGDALATKQPKGNYLTEHQSLEGLATESYVNNAVVSKQDLITGTAGQFVVIGTDGKPTTKTIPNAEEATF